MSSDRPAAENMSRFRRRSRMADGQEQRCCNICETWKLLKDFMFYGSYHGYTCKRCNSERQIARRARSGTPSNGTGNIPAYMKEQLNRIVDGVEERCCRRCGQWHPLETFSMSEGFRRYRCRSCDREVDRTYKRHRRESGRRQKRALRPVVVAFLSFAKQPTPQQLIERSKAA